MVQLLRTAVDGYVFFSTMSPIWTQLSQREIGGALIQSRLMDLEINPGTLDNSLKEHLAILCNVSFFVTPKCR